MGKPLLRKPADAAEPAEFPPRYVEFRAALKLDKDKLDDAVEQQAVLFHEVFEQHILASSRRDERADELTRGDAEIARAYRRRQEEAKEKCTESMVADAVMLDPEHIRRSVELAAAKREADLWFSLRSAFDHRVKMVKECVSLMSAQFFSMAGSEGARMDHRDIASRVAKERAHEQRKARDQ